MNTGGRGTEIKKCSEELVSPGTVSGVTRKSADG